MNNIAEAAHRKSLRELAREEDVAEKKLEDDLKELGFRRLTDFEEGDERKNSCKLKYNLDDMEKRKIQGVLGEKITVFIEGKMKRFISRNFPEGWNFKKDVRLKSKDAGKTLRFGQKPDNRESINISGDTVSHYGCDKEELRQRIRKKHFSTTEYLFRKFQENQIPSIDAKLYALKSSGEKRGFEYEFIDHTKNSSQIKRNTEKVSIDHVEDFKIIGLEVKTTKSDAENLLSTKQRKIRDRAENTAFLDFYTIHVEFELEESDIPTEIPVKIRNISR